MFDSPTAILIILAGGWFFATPDATRVDKDVTLSVYPSYSGIRGLDRETASGHMNWKTTFDATYHSSTRTKAGLGLLHISNGGYRDPNTGIEALRVALEYDF